MMSHNISLQQIRYFLTAADFQNVSQAAEYLHTSQSTVSKGISLLEKNLGISLFRREKKKLYLTEAGQRIRKKWKDGLDYIYQGIDEARLFSGGNATTVYVGVLDTHNPNLMVLPATTFFQKRYPKYETVVDNARGCDMSRNLFHRNLDVIFRIQYDVSEWQKDVVIQENVAQSPLVACMNKSNPLAYKKNISWRELRSCRFIVGTSSRMPYYLPMIERYCGREGFAPEISKVVDCANSMIYNLKGDREVFICDKFWRDYGNEGYVWKTIKNTRGWLMMEYRKDNQKPEVKKFIESVHDMILEQTGEPVIKL